MLDFLAEQRIAEAVSRGALDDDPLVMKPRIDERYYEKAVAKLGR